MRITTWFTPVGDVRITIEGGLDKKSDFDTLKSSIESMCKELQSRGEETILRMNLRQVGNIPIKYVTPFAKFIMQHQATLEKYIYITYIRLPKGSSSSTCVRSMMALFLKICPPKRKVVLS